MPVAEKLLSLVPPVRGVRRSRADKLHLTLHFLSDAPSTLIADLQLNGLPGRFAVTPGRLILLPESGPVRVVAASMASDLSPIRTLHALLSAELSRLGLPVEQRPHLPHITLARCDPPLPQQVRGQKPMTPREDVTFEVSQLHLIESRATDGGLEYVTRRTWTLA